MPEASEVEIEFAVIDRRTEGLQELELAVERLKPGNYGMCVKTGGRRSALEGSRLCLPLPGVLGARNGAMSE